MTFRSGKVLEAGSTASSEALSPATAVDEPESFDPRRSSLAPGLGLSDLVPSSGQVPLVSGGVGVKAAPDWPVSPFEPMSSNTPIELGSGLSLRIYAASELQEKDTLGFWNDFHTESLEEEQLNLAWAYRRRPGVSWVGRLGTPRVVDRPIDESLLRPGTVFATFGLQLSF